MVVFKARGPHVVAPGQKIAVIGGGISGNTAAHILSRSHDVTIFEREDYLGGHTNTRIISDGPDKGTPVDTGFIVCNERNYPNFYKLLAQLGVKLQNSEMSFGFASEIDGLRYLGPSFREFMRLPSALLKPVLIKLFFEQRRFGRRVIRDLNEDRLEQIMLHEYLDSLSTSQAFRDLYLYPLIGSIWSSPDPEAGEFPAKTFATFFRNHGMLDLSQRPVWQTVVGGSHAYVKRFQLTFPGRIFLNSPIASIVREANGVKVSVQGGGTEKFDYIVLATHADEALKLLADSSDSEREILGAWRYSRNETVLHTDLSVVPGEPRSWASWNYLRRRDEQNKLAVQISYYMNRLQNLRTKEHYIVTLNRADDIAANRMIYRVAYTHPIYSQNSVSAQNELKQLSGTNRTLYAGAHLGYGFHEDGVNSGIAVARFFGMEL